jgi:membrane peptidoglycan carboxypeptidase
MMGNLRRFRQKHFTTEHGRTDWKKISFLTALTFGSLLVFGILLFFTAIAVLSIGLPDVRDLDRLSVPQSTTIYDREGNVLYVNFGEENREYKKLNQISKNLVNATIAIEDDKFYQHPGFDMIGFARAAINNLTGGSQQGGSTITQQYIKLTFLTSEKSYTRKLKELILAVRLEEAFDKDTILEKYLNKIPYGNNAFGAEKAAQVYFNKSANDLNLAESAILAAIPQAPGYYNPYGPNEFSRLTSNIDPDELARKNINSEADLDEKAIKRGLIGQFVDIGNKKIYIQGRSDLVLRRMVETGYINEKEKDDALEAIHNIEFNKYRQNIKAPHFVFYVIEQLEQRYGKELVEQGGLKVYTTIDPKLQEIAEKAITDRAEKYEKNFNVKNAALVSMNPNNGQIFAMVGSRNYFDENIDGNTNIVTSFRQHGSTFKPIVYAAAFINRYSPASVIFDAPTPFGAAWPKNFDGKFQGPITLRKALGQSRNIPAIKAFFLGGEQKQILPLAKKMGVEFMNEDLDYGYPMALGTAETTLLSMTNAFGTFANGGLRYQPVSILKVENAEGQILEEWLDPAGEEALDPQIAYLITSILSDKSVNVGPNLNINGQTVAAKTGTSNRKNGSQYLPHDLLTLGYSTQLVTGVWAGNNNDKKDGPLGATADGYNIAAPIFKEFMEKALEGSPIEEFPIPEGIKQETVSKYSGKLVSNLTPSDQQITDFFASFAVPTEIDESYSGVADFTAAENLATAPCQAGQIQKRNQVVLHDIDPSREIWEKAAQDWLKENNSALSEFTGKVTCEDIAQGDRPKISISNMNSGDVITDKNPTVTVETSSPNGIKQVLYYLNGSLQYNEKQAPFSGKIRLPRNATSSPLKLTVRAFDNEGRISEDAITIYGERPASITETNTISTDENNS